MLFEINDIVKSSLFGYLEPLANREFKICVAHIENFEDDAALLLEAPLEFETK